MAKKNYYQIVDRLRLGFATGKRYAVETVSVGHIGPETVKIFNTKRAATTHARRLNKSWEKAAREIVNPPADWHEAQRAMYQGRLADDIQAGHGGAVDYWQGATSAESAAIAWHEGRKGNPMAKKKSVTWKDKLHPQRFPGMSGKMAAIVGFIMNRKVTDPAFAGLMVTSDNHLLGMVEGDVGFNEHLGSYFDLLNNWTNLLGYAGLTKSQERAAQKAFNSRIKGMKPQRAIRNPRKKAKYQVVNIYKISGESKHKTPEAALKAAAKREGIGWIVIDDKGNRWDWGPRNKAVIVERAQANPRKKARKKNPGAPNLDGMSAGDLWDFWKKMGASSVRPLSQARKMFPGRKKGIVRATIDLRNYAANKATAMQCRKRGDIKAALMYEGIADKIYKELPTWARW